MIRLLIWNIERFGDTKLNTNWWDTTGSRNWFIMNTISAINPDLIAVIEVQTGAGPGFGGLINGAGDVGSRTLLTQLRFSNMAAGWQLVPPLIISPAGGYSEGIAVYFKNTVFNFWGPNMINGAGSMGVPIAAGAGNYAGGHFANALPAGASTNPAATGAWGTYNQNQLAGRHAFNNVAGPVWFPNALMRSIWMTQFRYVAAAGARVLSLFVVHFPPKVLPARQAFAQLANVNEISGPLGVGGLPEDRVVCGDFNINALVPAQANAFQHLTGGPAVIGAAPVSAIVYAQQIPGASATSIKSVMSSSTTGAPVYYNYVKRSSAGQNLCIDNIFTVRQGGVAAPLNNLVNNRVIAPPMAISIPNIILGLPAGGARARRFRNIANYGMIGGSRGASDHMSVSIDVP
jgi:hypothetical protein